MLAWINSHESIQAFLNRKNTLTIPGLVCFFFRRAFERVLCWGLRLWGTRSWEKSWLTVKEQEMTLREDKLGWMKVTGRAAQ